MCRSDMGIAVSLSGEDRSHQEGGGEEEGNRGDTPQGTMLHVSENVMTNPLFWMRI